VAAVGSARERLARDLDRLTVELSGQMGQTMEKTAWKALGLLATVVSGLVARKALVALWRAVRHGQDPPANPASRSTTWGEAIGFAVASGVLVGVARLIAARGAAAGWQKVLGTLPPDMEDVSA